MKVNPVAVAFWLTVAGLFFCRHLDNALLSEKSVSVPDISLTSANFANIADISDIGLTSLISRIFG